MRRIANATIGLLALLIAGYVYFSGPTVQESSTPLDHRPIKLFIGTLFSAGGLALLRDAWKPGKAGVATTAYLVVLAGVFLAWVLVLG